MEWMLDIQLGRRNLSPIQRIAVAEKYRPIYESQALANKQAAMQEARKNNEKNKSEQFSENSSTTVNDNKIDVRAKLAKTAGVSTDTYSKGKKILDSDNKMLKQEVLSGEKRAQNYAAHYLPIIITCTYVYFACKSIYECECGITRVRGFRGRIWGLGCVVCICLLIDIFDVYTTHSKQIE